MLDPCTELNLDKAQYIRACGGTLYVGLTGNFQTLIQKSTRRSVEHCTPHADGAWLNELGWSQ